MDDDASGEVMMQAERDDDGTKVEGLKVPPTTSTGGRHSYGTISFRVQGSSKIEGVG